MVQNYKIVLQYDGNRYNGWQRQGNTDNTIQGRIEGILKKYYNQEIEVHGSGRTDAGVHAKGQVANYKVELNDIPKNCEKEDMVKLKHELNSYLPEDIKITDIALVNQRFHARLNAKEKEYRYFISLDKKRDVFSRKYVAQADSRKNFDIEAMKEAAQLFVGEHDFQGFSDNKSNKSTIRTVYGIEFMSDDSNQIVIIFRGNGFLYHTIRLMVGTLLAIAYGERDKSVINDIFNSRNRKLVPYMAPAEGLFLYNVKY